MKNYSSTISHEFRTPLGTSLMFLESLIDIEGLDPYILSTLKLIIMQLSLLLSLVNDVLDLKMIEQDKFDAKLENFNPMHILDFVTAIFKPMADLQRTEIDYETVGPHDLEGAFDHGHSKALMQYQELPSCLLGD